jgi:hypothetical protein
MAGFPEPEAGLVISYSYLWKEEEEERGQTEGRKDRPCAIVLAVDDPDPKADGRTQVAVAPITHSPPHDPNVAVEIPLRVKEHLGLDSEPPGSFLKRSMYSRGLVSTCVLSRKVAAELTMGCCRLSCLNV